MHSSPCWVKCDPLTFSDRLEKKYLRTSKTSIPDRQTDRQTLYFAASMTFCHLKRGKESFPSPTPSMQPLAAVQATCRKQLTPHLYLEGGGRVWIVLFSEVTPFGVQCLNNFVADWSFFSYKELLELVFTKVVHAIIYQTMLENS